MLQWQGFSLSLVYIDNITKKSNEPFVEDNIIEFIDLSLRDSMIITCQFAASKDIIINDNEEKGSLGLFHIKANELKDNYE